MDGNQSDHLKAYGIIFNHVADGETGMWLLNYRGGAFLTTNENDIVRKSRVRNVRLKVISESEAEQIVQEVERPDVNMAAINLEVAPPLPFIHRRRHSPGMMR
jgi:hypothetical protein